MSEHRVGVLGAVFLGALGVRCVGAAVGVLRVVLLGGGIDRVLVSAKQGNVY